ncbi:MAG: U32 family peptidase, partial [Ruminococcus sp.]|nr:U32 family peptidase [Ruminococcus sp.]
AQDDYSSCRCQFGFDVVFNVHSGADAVYVGAKAFSARASAHNFDAEELAECVRYCHRRGVKVHLALNTLIFDVEMADALELVKTAAAADIDALIIQDLGLVSLIKKMVPDLPLHASTQLSVHTPYGVKALYEMGFERVVLSRELSLDEIKEIREACPEVELEVFVHGALCMCVSGQCYFSAMLGGRSANRGMCAQPCRLPMKYGDNDHALSLKDNGSLHYLRELQDIGIASAKIEGRMKRPEYVAAATLAAREARDLGFITEKAQERLRSVFSRTGFTDGYLRGEIGEEMFGFRQKSDVVSADNQLLKEIRALYKDEYKSVPVSFDCRVKTGEKLRFSASDGVHTVHVESDTVAEKALHVPLSEERVAQSLKKTGNTPYFVEKITADILDDAAASAASINALRREALEQLDLLLEICHNYRINEIKLSEILTGGEVIKQMDRAVVRSLDIPDSMRKMDMIFVDVFGMEDTEKLKGMLEEGFSLGVEVPRATFGSEDKIFERLKELKKMGIHALLAHNIAAVYMGKLLGYKVHAGFGMNIANSYTLLWAKEYGIETAVLSAELDIKRIEQIHKSIPVGIIRYGYFPLMITRNAPAGKSCKTTSYLQDRKNERFPVVSREGYCEIYNCVPLLMPQKDYPMNGEVFSDFLFTVENSVENMEKIMQELRENRDFERKTHGLYLRGVKKFTIF